jgi:hypothetical protein
LAAQFAHNALVISRELGHEVGVLKALCLLLRTARQNPTAAMAGAPDDFYDELYVIAHNTLYSLEKALAYCEL